MTRLVRSLAEDDTSALCQRVGTTLSNARALHGTATYAFHAARVITLCGQSATKELTAPYGADLTLGDQ